MTSAEREARDRAYAAALEADDPFFGQSKETFEADWDAAREAAEREVAGLRVALAEAGSVLMALLIADRADADAGRQRVHSPATLDAMRKAEAGVRAALVDRP